MTLISVPSQCSAASSWDFVCTYVSRYPACYRIIIVNVNIAVSYRNQRAFLTSTTPHISATHHSQIPRLRSDSSRAGLYTDLYPVALLLPSTCASAHRHLVPENQYTTLPKGPLLPLQARPSSTPVPERDRPSQHGRICHSSELYSVHRRSRRR